MLSQTLKAFLLALILFSISVHCKVIPAYITCNLPRNTVQPIYQVFIKELNLIINCCSCPFNQTPLDNCTKDSMFPICPEPEQEARIPAKPETNAISDFIPLNNKTVIDNQNPIKPQGKTASIQDVISIVLGILILAAAVFIFLIWKKYIILPNSCCGNRQFYQSTNDSDEIKENISLSELNENRLSPKTSDPSPKASDLSSKNGNSSLEEEGHPLLGKGDRLLEESHHLVKNTDPLPEEGDHLLKKKTKQDGALLKKVAIKAFGGTDNRSDVDSISMASTLTAPDASSLNEVDTGQEIKKKKPAATAVDKSDNKKEKRLLQEDEEEVVATYSEQGRNPDLKAEGVDVERNAQLILPMQVEGEQEHQIRREEEHQIQREEGHQIQREEGHQIQREEGHQIQREEGHQIQREEGHQIQREEGPQRGNFQQQQRDEGGPIVEENDPPNEILLDFSKVQNKPLLKIKL